MSSSTRRAPVSVLQLGTLVTKANNVEDLRSKDRGCRDE